MHKSIIKEPIVQAFEQAIDDSPAQLCPGAAPPKEAMAFIQQYCQDKLVKEDTSIQMVMRQQLTNAFEEVNSYLGRA